MTEERKKIRVLVFLFIMSLIVIYMMTTESSFRKELREHPGKTICKYVTRDHYAKTSVAIVKYYVGDKLYINRASANRDDSKGTIDNFYELTYSTINPNNILVDFSKEINDTVLTNELERKLQFKYWFYHQK
ncbi:MAG: hypothetical protein PSV16_15675 [Flavobacterium sp.]|nr:hypothetical protein [Flavobacterium sp.]